jgi:hypothetical protein
MTLECIRGTLYDILGKINNEIVKGNKVDDDFFLHLKDTFENLYSTLYFV